ncbi:hypothetical protein AVEN_92646-1 [Araneus ventricosus]|uniref:RNase H type-1 domain-containing protein n=1 Tax=Araneus ventricosus TaxID=182803 RepID=A0A4Y2AIC3_ARAVE|nr:hypothetical protein AVEN_92646-1 [Araneus ventricosus]
MYVLKQSKWFVPSQSGFRRRRGTIDNLLKLETAIREAFVRKTHLVSTFFDIEKAYDSTWRHVRLSFTPTFGFRIREILRYFEIEDFPIISNFEGPPPWQETQVNFIDDFLHFLKPNTSDMVFQQHFYDHRQRYYNYVLIYTDGSKSDSHVGSAVVFPNFTIAETLHPFCSVYASELYAIYLGLLKVTTLNFKQSIIYTESRSGINALQSVEYNEHPLVIKCFELHHALKSVKIKYCWIPGHVGIPGNERADKATKTPKTALETFVPLTDALQAVKLSQHRVWQKIWDRQTDKRTL